MALGRRAPDLCQGTALAAVWQGYGFPGPILLCLGVDVDNIAKLIHKIVKDIGVLHL